MSNGEETAEGTFTGRWDLECATIVDLSTSESKPPMEEGSPTQPQWKKDIELETEFCAKMAVELRPPQQ